MTEQENKNIEEQEAAQVNETPDSAAVEQVESSSNSEDIQAETKETPNVPQEETKETPDVKKEETLSVTPEELTETPEVEKEIVAEEPLKKFVFEQPEPKNLSEVKPIEDFNWEGLGKKDELYATEERTRLENIYDNTLSTIQENEVIDGTVVHIGKREVVVNIGYKSEGVISANEFRYNPELKAGDTVEVFVENMEDLGGQLILSHKKAKALRSWERVNHAHDHDEVIKGFIKCRTKGGMIVDVFGIEAFLPGSQIDVKPIRDYDLFVGKTMEFKVVKINNEFKNVVVSHKALIEAELEEQKKQIIGKLEKGQVLEGTVKNITSYGVFIDLGGVD
jgi:small subunit ribosomal protein S1